LGRAHGGPRARSAGADRRGGTHMITARSVTNGLGGPFRVSGGPFAREQTMGWHITDERGFTLAVSCDAAFVANVLRWQEEQEALDRVGDGQFRLQAAFPGYAGLDA